MAGTAPDREMINRFDNPLPGVPLVESPFFDDAIAELELDEPTKAIRAATSPPGLGRARFPGPGTGRRCRAHQTIAAPAL